MSDIYKGNKIIHRSKNLRGIVEHARRVGPPERILLKRRDGSSEHWIQPYVMILHFSDGSRGQAFWANEVLAARWIRDRRTWRKAFDIEPISTTAFRDECTRLGV